MRQHYGWMIMSLLICLMQTPTAWATNIVENPWPREISVPAGVVFLYQPQPEKLDGNQLDARAAVAAEAGGRGGGRR